MKAALVYWTKSGNTEKVAKAIRRGLLKEQVDASFWKVDEAEEHNFLEYDLYCIGFPSYSWHTPEPVTKFLKEHHLKNSKAGLIKPCSPRILGKYAIELKVISTPSQLKRLMGQVIMYSEEYEKLFVWLFDQKNQLKTKDINDFKRLMKKSNVKNMEVIVKN